jgi:sugar/nucleoside kinase (ribokinase family)
MPSNFDVLVAGSYSVDLIFSGLPDFPKLGMDLIGTGFEMTPGEAYISAVSMYRLGLKVGWAADFGDDEFSRFALEHVKAEGLDDSLFVVHKRPYRRISVAASYPEDRAFITYYDPDPQLPAVISALLKTNSKILYVPGLYYGDLVWASLQLLHAKRTKLVMDGNSSKGDIYSHSKDSKAIRKAIQNTDIFMPNSQEAIRLTGEQNIEAAIHCLGELCRLVVVKDGVNGAYAFTDGQLTHVPAIAINAIDTTGAGDNYNAGFLRAWLDELSIEDCLKWGNIVGGLSTTALGGTTRYITCEEVREILSNWDM